MYSFRCLSLSLNKMYSCQTYLLSPPTPFQSGLYLTKYFFQFILFSPLTHFIFIYFMHLLYISFPVLLFLFYFLAEWFIIFIFQGSYTFSKFKFKHFSSNFMVHFQAFPAPAAVVNDIIIYSSPTYCLFSIPIISLPYHIYIRCNVLWEHATEGWQIKGKH